MAHEAAGRIRSAAFHVEAVEQGRTRCSPTPPFTTSTLQQEASRKLGFGVRRTMRIAQALYEGVEVGDETVGLISYMRTDSVRMSQSAAGATRRIVRQRFGKDYLPGRSRAQRAVTGNAREAHEAIRPTDFARTPETLEDHIGADEARLYDLIWKRAVASRMAAARLDRVWVALASEAGDIALAASGSETTFDGFLRVYREDGDDDAGDDDADAVLPEMAEGERAFVGDVRTVQRFTGPPPRYTEAGLVRRLEELGIGRPSSYGAIVGVLLDREYAVLHHRRFVPTERGRVVTAFLDAFFADWVAYGFTAGLERDLDRIAAGTAAWQGIPRGFLGGLRAGAGGGGHAAAARGPGGDCGRAGEIRVRRRGARGRPDLPRMRRTRAHPEDRPARSLRRLLWLPRLPLQRAARGGRAGGRQGAGASRRGAGDRARDHAAARPLRVLCPDGGGHGRRQGCDGRGTGGDGARRGHARRRPRTSGASARGRHQPGERQGDHGGARPLRPLAPERPHLRGDPERRGRADDRPQPGGDADRREGSPVRPIPGACRPQGRHGIP